MENLTINLNKEYNCDAKTLFSAVAEGILFKYTGAHMDKLTIDFREGGVVLIDWGDSHMKGEFKTIKPYEKIIFTWNNFSASLQKDISTVVTITIKETNGKSVLNLIHEGIGSEKDKADMTWGWNDGLDDMAKSYFKM